jgi:hypothetical protein
LNTGLLRDHQILGDFLPYLSIELFWRHGRWFDTLKVKLPLHVRHCQDCRNLDAKALDDWTRCFRWHEKTVPKIIVRVPESGFN